MSQEGTYAEIHCDGDVASDAQLAGTPYADDVTGDERVWAEVDAANGAYAARVRRGGSKVLGFWAG